MDRKINKEDLEILIEDLYSQWDQSQGEDKKFLAGQVEKYARHYHDITGNWYVRDPAKKNNAYSWRTRKITPRIDIGV